MTRAWFVRGWSMIALTVALALLVAACARTKAPMLPGFRDPDLSLDLRVNDLIGRLTTDEKISQMMMNSPAIPRLGIPAYYWWNEGLHGVARDGVATVFPQAIGLAATWNPELQQRVGDVISTEARAKNNALIRRTGGATKIYQGLTIWSPNINIFRDPRWGRGQETYGEDPFLTSRMGLAFVRGLQGDDPRYLKTVATVKHFAVHSGPEPLRHKFDAVVSDRDLRETYLPAFEACIREGQCASLMSAYNAIDGIPAPCNGFLLDDILRKEWGFGGAVVGDVDTVKDAWQGHKYAKDAAEASALSVKAGTDLCSGESYKALPEALKRGLISEADLDRALRRLFALRMRLGQFDPPERAPYSKIPITENDSPAHDRLALEAARQSLVLLKNDGTLPWNPRDLKRVAILGPTGDDPSALLGNYNGTPARVRTLVDGLRAKLEPLGVKVSYQPAVPVVDGFLEQGEPFPQGVLFTNISKATSGLNRELFDDAKFNGQPKSAQIDAQVDCIWNEERACPGIPSFNANLRWRGVLVPKETGEYTFSLTISGLARLYIDGASVLGDMKTYDPGGLRTRSVTKKLQTGRAYDVRLEFHQNPKDSGGRVLLGWQAPGALARALEAARKADHVILTLGITPGLEGEEMKNFSAKGFSGGDRVSILLPKAQRDLIDAVAALRKPFIVVLNNGSALSFDVAKPGAILESWYYGQRGGDAVAEAILGEIDPAGRLPVTFYASDKDLPPFENYSMANRTYRYFAGKPLYAFGHGLSYATFAYEKCTLSAATAWPGETVKLWVTVKNTSQRDGDEVVQAYATAKNPPVPMPLRQLVGFRRVSIRAGKTRTVEIDVPMSTLRRWDDASKAYVVDPGACRLAIGPASDQAKLQAKLIALR
jgi:beta-glucosidase